MHKPSLFRLTAFLTILLTQSVEAQNITETHWYFGNSRNAITFDKSARNPNLRTHKAVPFGTSGSAVINDRLSGNLRFYSDGQSVYDAGHELLPGIAGGTFLNGDPTLSQPVVACPFPDNSDRFYLFTNSGATIEYSVIDGAVQGNSAVAQFPYGDIALFNQAMDIDTPAEAMMVLYNDSRQAFWLITQNRVTFEFNVTPIDAAGVGTSTSYAVFPDGVPGYAVRHMAFNEDSVQIAIAPSVANRNVMVLDFDPATGEITFGRRLLNTGFADAGTAVISGVEWSGDGSKLYVSRTGDAANPGNIYQVDFADTTATEPPVAPVLPTGVFRSYGLKRGIDGRIYHLSQSASATDPFLLGRLTSVDSTLAAGVFYTNVFTADFQGTQLPQFAPAYLPPNFFTVDFIYMDSCLNDATKFYAQVDPLPHNYFWDFGDGSFGSGPAPIHTYAGAGGYLVNLVVELNGYTQTAGQFIDILPGDSAVDLGNDTTICVDEILELDAGEGIAYVWSTGEITRTIEVDTAGTYWVEVTGVSGCTSFDDIVVTEYGVARQIGFLWYFGEMAGLDFSLGAPVPIADDNMMFSAEGCATITDEDGQLLFYTNGNTVWNRDHDIMDGGTLIGGDSTAAQSAMILPFADDNTMFYILTTEEVYGDFVYELKLSVVDMKKDTAAGAVVVKNIPIATSSSERITASGFDGNPWILAHEYGNNSFRAHQININGLSAAIYSAVGQDHSVQDARNANGYMKFGPQLDRIGVALPGDSNLVELFRFDGAIGEVRDPITLNIEEPAPAQVYGLEFSGDGNKLYVTTTGTTPGKLIQYDLDSLNSENPRADIMATKFDGYSNAVGGYGALQRGPDGAIYMAVDGAPAVGSIGNPGANDVDAAFTESNLNLLGRTSRLGLPNFTQQLGTSPPEPSITTEVACAGQETSFSGSGRDNSIENYIWHFGDGTIIGPLTNPDTVHTYVTPGDYEVWLILTNRCDTDDTLRQTVTVFDIPQAPTVPEDTSLCGAPVTLIAWPDPAANFTYYWSTGDTTRTITITPEQIGSGIGIIDVAIINEFGCSSDTATVFIADQDDVLDLGPDRTICQNDSLVLDSNDPGPNYTWTRDGVVVGNTRTHQVNTNTPGDFVYTVSVTDQFTGCTFTDTVNVSIRPGPQAVQVNTTQPDCGLPNGSFQLDFPETGSFTYSLAGPVNFATQSIDGPGTSPDFTNLLAGSYTATITNAVTGCVTTEVLLLEDNAPFEMEAVAVNNCVRTSAISVNFLNRVPGRVEINIRNSFGSSVYSQIQDLTSRNVLVTMPDTGRYFVEVRDMSPPNCVQTDTVQLSVSTECYRSIFAPNAFSPNGNMENEQFFVFANEYVDRFTIYIYNRWGDLIYTANNKNFRWDGTYRGQFVRPGVYAYKMVFTSTLEPNLGEIEQYGSVTVVR